MPFVMIFTINFIISYSNNRVEIGVDDDVGKPTDVEKGDLKGVSRPFSLELEG